MTSVALLILRATLGGLLAGHGAQKLFGSFGGHGVDATAGWLETMNLRPGRQWAFAAGLSEFGGGVLTALGALNPLGPIMAMGSMLMATVKVHAGRPIWVTEGGAELPVTNMAVGTALMLTGPGKLSFDGLLGIRVPRWFSLAALIGMVVSVALAVRSSEPAGPAAADAEDQVAGNELQHGGDEAPEGGAPDGSRAAAAERPELESWGSPDPGEPVEDGAIAAMDRPEA